MKADYPTERTEIFLEPLCGGRAWQLTSTVQLRLHIAGREVEMSPGTAIYFGEPETMEELELLSTLLEEYDAEN